MARSLLGEIIHQICYTPPKHKKRNNNSYDHKPSKPKRDYAYEKMMFEREKALFENKKAIEIARLKAQSKRY